MHRLRNFDPRIVPMRLTYSLALVLTAPLMRGAVNTLAIQPASITGGHSANATLTLAQRPRVNTSFSIQLSGDTEYATAPSTVSVGQLEASGSFTITTRETEFVKRYVTVTAGGTSAVLEILPTTSLISFLAGAAKIGASIMAALGLDRNAPFGGIVVTLRATAADPGVLSGITLPASVTIPAGQKSISFPITVASNAVPGTVTVTATLGKVSLKQDIKIP
ncbi:MAG TPA: hypothetical protein VJ717_09590, partial [Gemmatimonadaceae bacterium]|nr:hypothetical protein [Gemmatimonadaceae bacterium]